VEAQFSISMHMLRLETLQNAVEAPDMDVGMAVAQCDPALDADSYARLNKMLDDLASQAPEHDPGISTVASLRHIKAELESLRKRHLRTWSESAEVERIDPRMRCLSAAGVAGTRMEIERETRKILQTLVQPPTNA
jgi:hypothetical protein